MLRKGLLNSFVSSFAGFLSSSTELAVGVLILAIGGNMVIQGFGTLTVGRLIAFQVRLSIACMSWLLSTIVLGTHLVHDD